MLQTSPAWKNSSSWFALKVENNPERNYRSLKISVGVLIPKEADDSEASGNAALLGKKCRTFLVVWACYEKTLCAAGLSLLCPALWVVS